MVVTNYENYCRVMRLRDKARAMGFSVGTLAGSMIILTPDPMVHPHLPDNPIYRAETVEGCLAWLSGAWAGDFYGKEKVKWDKAHRGKVSKRLKGLDKPAPKKAR